MKETINIARFIVISLLTSLLLFSCLSQNKILQNQEYLKRIKSFDATTSHYCTTIGLDFSNSNPIRSEMFFRCKVELAKRAKISSPLRPQEMIFNRDLERYILIQDHKYMNSIEDLNYHRNSLIDNTHHKACVKRGYKIDSLKQDEIESYLTCRESLILSFEIKPAYQNEKDLNYRESSYNIDYVVNKKQDKEIKIRDKFSKKYPFCSKFKVKSPRALKCKDDYDKKRSCKNKVKMKSFAKTKRFHEICQQKLYIKLPNSLLIKKDKKRSRSQERNFNTDLYLNQSYYQFLSDKKMRNSFMAKDGKEVKSSKKSRKKKINNSFKALYTRDQLTGLRQRFISSCISQIDPKIDNFLNAGYKMCNTLTLNWEHKSKKQ